VLFYETKRTGGRLKITFEAFISNLLNLIGLVPEEKKERPALAPTTMDNQRPVFMVRRGKGKRIRSEWDEVEKKKPSGQDDANRGALAEGSWNTLFRGR